MARKRMIDPEFWSDEEVGHWSYEARLFYIGLWNFADDEGRFKAHSKLLKAQIFPYDNRLNIEKVKKEVAKKVQWYNDNGLQYGYIRNFLKYQRIDRPTPSKLPEPKQLNEASPSPQRNVPPNIREVKLSKEKLSKDILNIVEDLNLILNTTYKPTTKATCDLIQARLNEGFGLDDFKVVHRKMLYTWGADPKMYKYLRPQTLYSPKFESYLNMREQYTKLTQTGIRAYLIGQEWLKKQEAIDAK